MALQEAAETALRNRISLINAEGGKSSAEIRLYVNPQTGEVLALVSHATTTHACT